MSSANRFVAIIFCWVLLTTSALALEPPNIHFFKQKLIHYHDSGQYDYDVNKVINNAKRCLETQIKDNFDNDKLALVLDIDETALSLYDFERKLNFGFSEGEFKTFIEKTNMQAIPATLSLYNFAKKNGVAVFFVTGRIEPWRELTIKSLITAGYKDWNGLYMRPENYRYKSIVPFKTSMRNLIRSQGYEIVLNIGDQESDLFGDEVVCKFRLPNPFYLISINEIIMLLH